MKMKDLGEQLKVNIDSNQNIDHKQKQPKGKCKHNRFKKLKKKLNVEKIPGSK